MKNKCFYNWIKLIEKMRYFENFEVQLILGLIRNEVVKQNEIFTDKQYKKILSMIDNKLKEVEDVLFK